MGIKGEMEKNKEIKQYSRFYFFEFLPWSFHHLMMIRLLKMGWKIKMGWNEGFILINQEESLKVEIVRPLHLLKLYVRSFGKSGFVSSLLDGFFYIFFYFYFLFFIFIFFTFFLHFFYIFFTFFFLIFFYIFFTFFLL